MFIYYVHRRERDYKKSEWDSVFGEMKREEKGKIEKERIKKYHVYAKCNLLSKGHSRIRFR